MIQEKPNYTDYDQFLGRFLNFLLLIILADWFALSKLTRKFPAPGCSHEVWSDYVHDLVSDKETSRMYPEKKDTKIGNDIPQLACGTDSDQK